MPPGSACGHRCVTAPWLSVPKTDAVPPAAGTRMSVTCWPVFDGVKMIVSSSVQVPPRPVGASHSVIAAPPVTETFFSWPPAKNAIHWPSGEKNGAAAPSVPASRRRLQLVELPDEEPRLARLLRDKRERRPVGRQNGRRARGG